MNSTTQHAARTRERVHRRRRVVLATLPAHEREAIVDETFALWSLHFTGYTREEFATQRLFDDTRLHLLYGASGELAAFLNFTVDPVAVGGRRLLVVSCALVSRLNYRAMVPMAIRAVREVVRVRLSHPLHRLAYAPAAASPISFGVLARFTPTYYPHVDGVLPPDHVVAALAEVAGRRGITLLTDDPWVASTDVVVRDPERIRSSRTLRDPDRFLRWFLARTPRWDQSEVLMMWIPLTFGNVSRGLARMLLRKPLR